MRDNACVFFVMITAHTAMSARLMPAPADGREFTSYISSGQLEDALQRRLGVQNENQYRAVLQRDPKRINALVTELRKKALTTEGRHML